MQTLELPKKTVKLYQYGDHCMTVGQWACQLGVTFSDMYDEIVICGGDVSEAIGNFIKTICEAVDVINGDEEPP